MMKKKFDNETLSRWMNFLAVIMYVICVWSVADDMILLAIASFALATMIVASMKVKKAKEEKTADQKESKK